jgi:hypothetical protein
MTMPGVIVLNRMDFEVEIDGVPTKMSENYVRNIYPSNTDGVMLHRGAIHATNPENFKALHEMAAYHDTQVAYALEKAREAREAGATNSGLGQTHEETGLDNAPNHNDQSYLGAATGGGLSDFAAAESENDSIQLT